MAREVLAIYGNVMLPRAYCDACEAWSIVVRGRRRCCDREIEPDPKKLWRVSEPDCVRAHPKPSEKRLILDSQNGCCLYCELPFGTRVIRRQGAKGVRLLLRWDHMVPWAHTQNNQASNFAAACQICNGIKSDRVFRTIEEAKVYVALRRAQKYANSETEL